MSALRPALVHARHPVAIVGLTDDALDVVTACCAARGLGHPDASTIDDLAARISDGVVAGAWIDAEPATAAALAPAARAAALATRPLLVLARIPRGRAIETAASLAYLRAHGAAVFTDPDAWIEALCLVAAHGAPAGPRTSVVAPDGGYLAVASRTLGPDDGRRPSWASRADELAPTDVVLVARASWAEAAAAPPSTALRIPLVERAELLGAAPAGALVGLRAALAATTTVGRAAERARAGLGPAGRSARAELEVDEDRLARQLAKLATGDVRLGDHESKTLLSAYGVAITRQAVATSTSAALRIAAKAGFPVDVKPWGPDVVSERDGCPIERDLTTAADVRRAFAAVLTRAGQPVDRGAVIVRASPAPGREVSARIAQLPHLGWTVIVETPGQPPEAAPAPLRVADAAALAAVVIATRAGDDEPDRVGLANLLRRASHLTVDHAGQITRLDLGRIVVGPKGAETLVVDAEITLAPR